MTMVWLLFFSFLALLAVGVPVAYSLGISSALYFLGTGMPLNTMVSRFFAGMDSFTLLCIPGFILAGNLMSSGGISRHIINFANKLVGHIRGGLALVNVLDSMIFAGVSGTAAADVASLGTIMIPAMVNEGYDADFSVGITAASSCVGPLIPPSVPMIIAGTLTGISVSKMFLGGIIPGLLMGLGQYIVVQHMSKKRGYPKNERRATLREVLSSGKNAFWALLMTVIILGSILSGMVTPTEASVVAVFYALLVGFFVYKELTFKKLLKVAVDSIISAAAIMALVGFASIFAYILTKEQIPTMIANGLLAITTNKFLLLLLINILLLFVGMFMETIAALLILFPVLLSVAVSVGVDPVQFGVIAVLNLVIGLTTPPVGVCLFISSSIAKISLSRATKGVMPFLLVNLAVLVLVTYFPPLTTFLVSLLY